MPQAEDLRTRVASQAATLAEAVGDGFRTFAIGPARYGVELQVPQGQSTGGGIQARQNLCLTPRVAGYSVIVAGNVDPVSKTAELRGFPWVQASHQARFKAPIPVTAEEYATFLKLAVALLQLAGIRATVINVPPADLRSMPPGPMAPATSGGGSALLILLAVAVAALAFGLAFAFLRR